MLDGKKFLESLVRPGQYMELRAIRIGGGVVGRAFADSMDTVDRFSLRYGRDAEIYMGVAPRLSRDGGGGQTNCGMPRALWIDGDNEKAVRAELALFELEPTVVVRSGGGLHIYWHLADEPRDWDQAKTALRQLAARLEGDVKSAEPAHVLRVPGTMNHKYSPPRRVEIESMNLDRRYLIGDVLELTRPRQARSAAFVKARAWMAEFPPAVQGEHGDDATYRAACMLVRDMGLGTEEAFELMWEWNQRCVPPWTGSDLMKKIRGAEAYGQNDRGQGDPVRDFEEVLGANNNGGFEQYEESLVDKVNALMTKMTAEFKSVDENGKYKVYAHRPDDILGRKYWVRYDWQNFLRVCDAVMHYGDVKINAGDKIKSMPAGQFWLTKYKKKTTYRGIVYAPEYDGDKTPDERLNIWTGFAVTPAPEGSWESLKKLTLQTLCGSNVESYEYVMNWMARAVQMPAEPGGVTLVFKGPKGTGKSTLGTAFVRLFGQHGMHITSPSLLTGRFNAHLRDISALFADEAFWAGDKVGEGVLKGLVTESTITYEGKGTNAESGRNCVHLMMASNEDWVVPAGFSDERRFAVFAVDNNVRDRSFWHGLRNELHAGGLRRMLHDLKTRDISKFDVFQVPQTSALAEQKMQTMRTSEMWLWDLVNREYEDVTLHPGNVITMDDLEASIDDFYKRKRLKPSVTSLPMHLGKLITKMLPTATKTRIPINEKRRWGYVFPAAEDAKKHIEKIIGLEHEEDGNAGHAGQHESEDPLL